MTLSDGLIAAASPPEGISQSELVVLSIKAMITRGDLRAGSRLPIERNLAGAFGVSRGSLREGVRALCILGVLETRQGDGTYVTSLDSDLLLGPIAFVIDLQSPEQRADLHAVRRVLESEAAAKAAIHIAEDDLSRARESLESARAAVFAYPVTDHDAAMRADVEFHRVVARASGNAMVAALINALADRTILARRTIGVRHEQQVRTAFLEHEAILAALAARDPDRARLLMGHHLLAIEDYVHQEDGFHAN